MLIPTLLVLIGFAGAPETPALCPHGDVNACQADCEAGRMLSCARLGRILDSSLDKRARKKERDPAGALKAFTKACTASYLPACVRAARLLVEQRPPQTARARKMAGDACRAGDPEACHFAGIEEPDDKAAAGHFKVACAYGIKDACRDLRYLFMDVAPRKSDVIPAWGRRPDPIPAPPSKRFGLVCPKGAQLFLGRSGLLQTPHVFCARRAKKEPIKYGPSLLWASFEDFALGRKGAIAEEGAFVDGRRDGPWLLRNKRNIVVEKGGYRRGKRHGVWARFEDGISVETTT